MNPGTNPPSPADLMRLHLALERLRESRELNKVETPPATLAMTLERLETAVEDLAGILRQCWSEAE